MLSSFFSGISGLIANSSSINVVGNNIANVNTVGFKGSRATFEDVLYQSISGTSGSSQVGRGTALSSVDTSFGQGSFESTSESTDLAIGGKGFFIVRSEESQTNYYTRAGQFRFDADGYMTNPAGEILQGRQIDRTTNAPYGVDTDIIISQAPSEPRATEFIGMNVNLQSDADVAGTLGSLSGVANGSVTAVALSEGKYPRVGAEIGKLGEEVSFTRDDVIFKGDEPGSFFYELVEGEVDIIVLEKENMHFIVKRPGEIFGWSALVEPYVYSATARCLAPTRVIRIGRDIIENVVKRHPEEGLIIYKHIIGIVAQRLRSAYQYIYRQH